MCACKVLIHRLAKTEIDELTLYYVEAGAISTEPAINYGALE